MTEQEFNKLEVGQIVKYTHDSHKYSFEQIIGIEHGLRKSSVVLKTIVLFTTINDYTIGAELVLRLMDAGLLELIT